MAGFEAFLSGRFWVFGDKEAAQFGEPGGGFAGLAGLVPHVEMNGLFPTNLAGQHTQRPYATEPGMSTVAPRISSALVVELVAQGIDAVRRGAAQVRGLWQDVGWGGLDKPGPQTEGSIESGFRHRGPVDDDWGRSESLDPDNGGDIADEGMGPRG